MADQAEGIGDPLIVASAEAARVAAAGKAYKWAGHTTAGFDCSGFVIYSLRHAYPDRGFTFITAAQIFADGRFEVVEKPQPGDLIAFRHGPGTPNDHIGIVHDAGHWVGAQSSTGVARVSFGNAWWSAKPHFFLRLKP